MMRERLRDALGLQRMNLFTREGASLVIYDAESEIPRRATIVEFGAMPAEGPLVLTDPTGNATTTLAMPAGPFNGVRLHGTWLCLDPAANAFGLVPSGFATMIL